MLINNRTSRSTIVFDGTRMLEIEWAFFFQLIRKYFFYNCYCQFFFCSLSQIYSHWHLLTKHSNLLPSNSSNTPCLLRQHQRCSLCVYIYGDSVWVSKGFCGWTKVWITSCKLLRRQSLRVQFSLINLNRRSLFQWSSHACNLIRLWKYRHFIRRLRCIEDFDREILSSKRSIQYKKWKQTRKP